jgi:DNA-binding transcriptional regulator YdaS (Cro superfamily)
MDELEALREAAKRAGSQAKLAQICKRDGRQVTQPAVWRWLNKSKRLPAEHVLDVEAETGVSRHDLRPDIYPRDYVAARLGA